MNDEKQKLSAAEEEQREDKSSTSLFSSSSSIPALISKAAGGFEVIASLLLFAVSSISMIILNKLIMTTCELDFPLVLLFLQNFAALLVVVVAKAFGLVHYPDFDLRVVKRWIPLTLCFVVMLWSSMRSLSLMSVAAFTVLKFSAVVLTAFGDSYFFGKPLSPTALGAFALMGFGGYLATHSDKWVTTEGLAWTFVNVLSTVAFTLYMKALLSDVTKEIGRWGPVFYNNLLSLPFLIVPTLNTGLDFHHELRDADTKCMVAFSSSLVASAVLSFASFWAMQQSGPTTYGVVGAFDRVPMTFLGIVIFNQYPTTMGYVGLTCSFAAGIVYAYVTASSTPPATSKTKTDSAPVDASAPAAATSSPISMASTSAYLFAKDGDSSDEPTSVLHRIFSAGARNQALIILVAVTLLVLTLMSSSGGDSPGGGDSSGVSSLLRSIGSSSASAGGGSSSSQLIDFGKPRFRRGGGGSPLLNGVIVVAAVLGDSKNNGVTSSSPSSSSSSFFLEYTLPTLDQFVLGCFPYPLLVFHDEIIASPTQQNRIKSMVPKGNTAYHEMFPDDERHIVRFDDISEIWATLPDNVSKERVAAARANNDNNNTNYYSSSQVQQRSRVGGGTGSWYFNKQRGDNSMNRQRKMRAVATMMNRFWLGLVWNRKSLDEFEYYWRIGSDSAFRAPLRVDPFYFVFVKQRGVYAYHNKMVYEPEFATVGLFDHFKAFLINQNDNQNDNKEDPVIQANQQRYQQCIDFFSCDKQRDTYNYNHLAYDSNHFEMGLIALKKHERFQKFFRWVDQREPLGMYRYGWGDAPLHSLGIHFFEQCLSGSARRIVKLSARNVPFWHQDMAPYEKLKVRSEKAGKCPRSSKFARRWR